MNATSYLSMWPEEMPVTIGEVEPYDVDLFDVYDAKRRSAKNARARSVYLKQWANNQRQEMISHKYGKRASRLYNQMELKRARQSIWEVDIKVWEAEEAEEALINYQIEQLWKEYEAEKVAFENTVKEMSEIFLFLEEAVKVC